MTNQDKPSLATAARGQVMSGLRVTKESKFWMLLSVLLSICLLIWAFTLPFRNRNMPNRPPEVAAESDQSPLAKSAQRRALANQHREAALEMDRELMSYQREKERKYLTRKLPGAEEAKIQADTHRQWVVAKIAELESVAEGSLQWHYRVSLEESLLAPQ